MSWDKGILLNEEILSNIPDFQRVERLIEKDFAVKQKIVYWINKKGNFKISYNDKGNWDIYFAMEFSLHRIKDNLKYLDELAALYGILTNDRLVIS